MDTCLPGRSAPDIYVDLCKNGSGKEHLLLIVGPEPDEGAVEGAGGGRQLPHPSHHQHHQQAEDQPWAKRKWV